MDAIVLTFNDEIASLLHTKPPVTKAKMCTITKAAMRGVKFYKHVVQIVEKFIAKCRPEYKVPGLYVIDSIVRQSRHQFGPDRDVYAARFARNLGITFENLFSDCLEDDKARMVRVLNLWLKNGVFDKQTIRPLLEMAENSGRSVTSFQRDPKSPSSGETNTSSTIRQYHSASKYQSGKASGDLLKFSKNMLDFDYGEDDDDDADETPTEAEPPMSSTLSKIDMEQRAKRTIDESNRSHTVRSSMTNTQSDHLARAHTPPAKIPPKAQTSTQDPVLERWNKILKGELTSEPTPVSYSNNHQTRRRSRSRSPSTKLPQNISSNSPHKSNDHHKHHHHHHNHHHQRESETESERRRASEKAGATNPERAAERERKCLPKLRDKHLTVCSSTLWLGHVPKMISEADISDAFGEFGTINSIDLIPPRGCAFVCMDRRQDAKRALSNSKRIKLNGSYIRMAWAPGKGLKEQKNWKDYWDSDVGASYVPYSSINLDVIDFEQLEDGGVIDEDSMSKEMLDKRDCKNASARGHNSIDSAKIGADPSRKYASSDLDADYHHATSMPLFNQPPPSSVTGLPSFVVPPPPLNLGIPPPMILAQGLMPFPPLGANSNALLGPHLLPQAALGQTDPSKQNDDNAPTTERKINMVEQHLSMLQNAANVQLGGDFDSNGGIYYPFAQPDPMAFDYRSTHPQMLQMAALVASGAGGNHLDPNQIMFDGFNPQAGAGLALNPTTRLLPSSEPRDSSNLMDENYLDQKHGNY